jgi:hypothetical protein
MSEINEILIDWLNKSRGTVSQSRDAVCGLLTALRGLEPLLREHPIVEVPEYGHSAPVDTSPGALLREAINKQLVNYQFTPMLLVTDTHKLPIRWLSPNSNDSKEIEATMIRTVCDLHNDGTLSRLHECLCGKWFMARSNNQECCSTVCRQKKWGKTDKGKAAGKKASKDSYDNKERQPHIRRIKAAIKDWQSKGDRFKATRDWKEWVADAASVTKVFITKAVNKREIVPPPEKLSRVRARNNRAC